MALFVDLAGGCEKILRQMKDIAKTNYAFELGRKNGMLDFLTSPVNGSVKMDLNNVQEGKKYVKSKVVYKKRTKPCEILTDDSVGDVCDTPTEPTEESVDVTITKRVGTQPKAFTNANMINICQDTNAFIQEYVMSDMRALREKVNEVQLALADDAIGVNHEHDGTSTAAGAYKTLQILGTSADIGQQVPLYSKFVEVGLDYSNNQLSGIPQLVGQGNLEKFMTLQKFACCNSYGVAYENAIAQSGVAFYLDQSANNILGANKFLSIAPNTLHLLWFNKNRNININSELVRHIVVPDPIYPGLAWDLDFKWDECDEKWIYRLSAWHDQFKAYQADAFGADGSGAPSPNNCEDELVGTTGVFGYTATSA